MLTSPRGVSARAAQLTTGNEDGMVGSLSKGLIHRDDENEQSYAELNHPTPLHSSLLPRAEP